MHAQTFMQTQGAKLCKPGERERERERERDEPGVKYDYYYACIVLQKQLPT